MKMELIRTYHNGNKEVTDAGSTRRHVYRICVTLVILFAKCAPLCLFSSCQMFVAGYRYMTKTNFDDVSL